MTKYIKVTADIKFIELCKVEKIIPKFAKVNWSIKSGGRKLKLRIARLVMESEIQSKHLEKKKLKKELQSICIQLKSVLGLFLYNALLHKVSFAVKTRQKAILKRHEKKLIKFRKNQNIVPENHKTSFAKCIVHNFSSYDLSDEEITALSYGLDTHIPTNTDNNTIATEFELFSQNVLIDILDIPESEISKIKTKLRNTCEKYSKVKVLYRHRKIVLELSKNKNIVILKQDKGRGVVVMDKHKYLEKCMSMLTTKHFKLVDSDPTKTLESKVQRSLRKLKSRLSPYEYKKLYPTGSCPGKFYGTAKLHKLPVNGKIDDLLIRPIVSNINTATYQLAKHLSKVPSPLRESEHNIKSTKDFIRQVKEEPIPAGYEMVSFDVKSLFTNVPLDRTIDIILNRIYDHKELETPITRCEMKEMLTLCTKIVHFTYNRKIFVQTDGVAMGSPLGPVFADILMIELEKSLLPDIYIQYIKFWMRYIDDTTPYVKIGSIKHISSLLNSFHKNIQFTFESENKGTLPFLDVLLCRNGSELTTTVYRKKTNNDIYLNWNIFAPVSWKRGKLRTLVQRAYLVCSTETYLKKELTYLEKVFIEKNNYPKYVIIQVFTQVKEEHKSRNYNNNIKNSIAVSITLENENEKRHSLTIPYQDEKGDYLIKSMK